MPSPIDLFGGSSEGSMRMEEWLTLMCQGCVKDRGRGATALGGMSCELPSRAYADPYKADMAEWSPDASPRPERLAELGDGPWPVCLSYRPRKKRSGAGKPRQVPGMASLFDPEVA